MKYGSVCSGIEAATVAWHPLGWMPVWFSEIEKFPRRVLAHHYPNVPNLGDMTKLRDHEEYIKTTIDLLVGGTPCQSFSIAGLRKGLDSENGNLSLEYCRILLAKQPRWFVWENVPGVFSSFTDETASALDFHSGLESGDEFTRDITETADFATLLEAFRECGYSVAYRVLDSQYFGVPQRRRRVLVVGYFGDDWRPPAAVLFESESLRWDFTPSRKEGKVVAALTKSGVGTCGADDNQAQAGHIVATLDASYAHTQGASGQDLNHGHSHLVVHGSQRPIVNENLAHTVGRNRGQENVLFQPKSALDENWAESCTKNTLRSGESKVSHAIVGQTAVRRLTPLECERLQGFPDNYTNIPGASDSARYAAIGNSMTTYVMRWIGERIDLVDKTINRRKP